MFGDVLHRKLYLIGLITLTFGISLSPFLMSIGQFLLVGNWIAEGKYKVKLHWLKMHKAILGFMAIYVIHIFWLLNTTNFGYALQDLKIKIPLLALPLIIGTSEKLTFSELKLVMQSLLLSVFIAIAVQVIIYFGFTEIPAFDSRKASVFMSHIRFSLVVLVALFTTLHLMKNKKVYGIKRSLAYSVLLGVYVLFIFGVGAFTGVVLFIIIIPLFAILSLKNSHKGKRITILIGTMVFVAVVVAYVIHSYYRYNDRNEVELSRMESHTINGNRYIHSDEGIYENKDLVWNYLCVEEVSREWKKRSGMPFWGSDMQGQAVRHTLYRYLTSKGYRKDSVGMSKLSDGDIKNIESGMTNYLYGNRYSLYPKLYRLFWQIERYVVDGNPTGHSATQRIEFAKNSIRVFKRHFWFGTGTGDIKDEVKYQYKIGDTMLDVTHRFGAHNQYITFLASFGIIGFGIVVLCFCFAISKSRSSLDGLSMVTLAIILLSMISEDTLETQVGSTIAAFFISLYILGRKMPGQLLH